MREMCGEKEHNTPIFSHNVSGLVRLSEREDSLFQLSFIPFHVTSFTRGDDILVAKPVTNSLSTAREEEAIYYLGLGGSIAFLFSAGLLVCILLLVNRSHRVRDKEPLIVSSRTLAGTGRYQNPPQTIYSQHFSKNLAQRNQHHHHFTPLDESLCPITDTELGFTPRYLREEVRDFWMSEGSLGTAVDIHSDPGGFRTPSDFKHNLRALSEDGSINDGYWEDMPRQSYNSPFYCQRESPLVSPVLPSHQHTVLHRCTRQKNGKTPPRPPSRSVSLNPNSKTKTHSTPGSSPPLPPSVLQSKNSPTVTMNPPSLDSHTHGSRLSMPCPTPNTPLTTSAHCVVTNQQIEEDVHHVMSNLGIDNNQ